MVDRAGYRSRFLTVRSGLTARPGRQARLAEVGQQFPDRPEAHGLLRDYEGPQETAGDY